MVRLRTPITAVLVLLMPGSWGSAALAADDGGTVKSGRFLGAKPTEYPGWFKQSFLEYSDDVREAAAQNKRLMVMFHQDNCPYCNALVERNLSQKHIEDKVRRFFEVIAINMWGDREILTVDGQTYSEKSFAEALRVQFTPTLIFFNEEGKAVLRLNGYLPPQQFETALDYVSQKKEYELPYSDFVASRTSRSSPGKLRDQDFFSSPPYDVSAATGKHRPIAVFFEQGDCPNCDTLHLQVLNDPHTRDLVSNFTCIQLDMWSQTPVVTPAGEDTTARRWAKALNLQYAPSIVLFDPAGREIIRSEALFKLFHTQSIFDYVLSGAYKNQPNFQRYISARAERIREQGIDVDIWK